MLKIKYFFFQSFIILLMSLFFLPAFGQEASEEDIRWKTLSFNMHYGAAFPGNDLNDRFGYMNNFGGGLEFLTGNNWHLALQGNYYFGNEIKEDVLSNLRTSDGVIIGNDMAFANIFMRSRAWSVHGSFGKLIPLGQKVNSGLLISLGGGFISHKVRIQDDSQSVPQVIEDNVRGYDRLTGGLLFRESIGYYSNEQSARGNFRFYVMLEGNQGLTEGLRRLNYSDNTSEYGKKRLDSIWSIKVGFILPLQTYGGDSFILY